MKHNENMSSHTIGGGGLSFVRRAADGHELTETELSALALTNDTITRVVSAVAGRITASADGSFSENIISG